MAACDLRRHIFSSKERVDSIGSEPTRHTSSPKNHSSHSTNTTKDSEQLVIHLGRSNLQNVLQVNSLSKSREYISPEV